MDCVGASLDCNMIIQINPRRGIMVTLKMNLFIARADAIIFICFVDGVVEDRLIDLNCLEKGLESMLARTSRPERSKGSTDV